MTIRRVDTAKSHYYRDDHGRVPGVTTILGALPKTALINWAANATADYAVNNWPDLDVLPPAERLKRLQGGRHETTDRAKARGTEVHELGERLVKGEQVQVPDHIAGHVEGYARFLDAFGVEPVLTEFTVGHDRYRYAGTGDLIARFTMPNGEVKTLLADLKTNAKGIYGETALQLAAYRYAEYILGADGEPTPVPEVDGCAAIHVRGDGSDLIPVTADEQQFRQFLYVQQTFEWDKHARDLVGAPVVPPTTSTFRLVREDNQT